MSPRQIRPPHKTPGLGLAVLSLLIPVSLLSVAVERPAKAQSPGGNLGALLARLQADEVNITAMQATITSLQSTVTSQQNTIDQMTSGGVKPAGPAGGDLSGSFPSPTIAPNAIGHTKLASDPGSLAQVSGGLLAASGSTANVQGTLTVQGDLGLGTGLIAANHDINIARNTTVQGTLSVYGDIGSTGAQFFLRGRGGGDGNNSNRGLAVVDGGPGQGLVLNYQNDFGTVGVQSNMTVFGTMTANTLQINGGGDVAEPYKISAHGHARALPGMVVSINPRQPGSMRISTHAYDALAGGIISGANGIRPGITLRQAGTIADGALPVASIGRVWCYCDTHANGPIKAGDLLTTSSTPGHAMRVTDYNRARGAVLGKAMSPLKSGRGLVLVLVTLQ